MTKLNCFFVEKTEILFPNKNKIDSVDHYEDHLYLSPLSFKAPINSCCNENSSQGNDSIRFIETSFDIDFFPEKSSPILKTKEGLRSFSQKSKRNIEICDFEDSIMEDWKEIDDKQLKLKNLDLKELLSAAYDNKAGYQVYKIILDRIEKHLYDVKHTMGLLLKEYLDYFLKTYQFIDQVLFEKISMNDLENILDKMMKDIHQFSRVFQIALSEFYQFKSLKKKNSDLNEFLNENNIENFVIQMIYQKQEVYEMIYEAEKFLSKRYEKDLNEAKYLFRDLEIKDCFTPFEKKAKIKLLTPNMRKSEGLTNGSEICCPKGFDNFSLALDYYDDNFINPFTKYKELIEGIKFIKNPFDKLMFFSEPRLIILKFMNHLNFPYFNRIDIRDQIKILFFLLMKTDLVTIFIELNLIIHSVKATETNLKIVNTLLKSITKIIKLTKENKLEMCLKDEGFLAKLIERKYLKKTLNNSGSRRNFLLKEKFLFCSDNIIKS